MDLRQRLQTDLNDGEYRHAYADEHLNLSIGTQIKVVREERGMTQAELADKIGTKQTGISRLESANYAGWSIAVLRRVAKAFDLRLHVSFEEFGSLWSEVEGFSRLSLRRRKFSDDPEFKEPAQQLEEEAEEAVAALYVMQDDQGKVHSSDDSVAAMRRSETEGKGINAEQARKKPLMQEMAA
jgi:transcriptional regulator with XRE-family HTH domain